MKQFIILAIVVAVAFAQTDDQKVKIDGHIKHCTAETGVTEEDARRYIFAVVGSDERKNQCFVKCFFERSEFMDGTGTLNTDVMYNKLSASLKEQADKDHLREVIGKCTSAEYLHEDPCTRAFKVHNCYWAA